ncbi:MerR family transcriptional regulator [Rhizobium sp.]
MGSKVLTIGRLASATGTNIETIRYYERSGILPRPSRTDGNYRSYDPEHLNRLSFIRRARDLGFSIDQIKTLLTLSDDRTQSCAAVDDIAKVHREEVERKIKDLQALKTELDRIVDTCRCGTVAECRIIESLSPPVLQE